MRQQIAGVGIVTVSDLDDPRVADYVALNDPARRRRVERDGGFFVVEGPVALERLLDDGTWTVRSLLVLPRVAERLAPRLDGLDAPVLVADPVVLEGIVGFDLHRGALASVDRRPAAPLDDLVRPGALIVVCEALNDHENLGALYRNAAAFGASGIALDPTSADPFYRRSVRVSMGHVLDVPTAQVSALPAGLDDLRTRGVEVLALTPRTDAVPLQDLSHTGRPRALLVGAEGPGLTDATVAAADVAVRIPLAPGVDSLNVATATAIALHHLTSVR